MGFRPLSGSYISQLSLILFTQFDFDCFRPLSGSYISQLVNYDFGDFTYKFPSPIGELHFSMRDNGYLMISGSSVSVPYRGATFLNCTCGIDLMFGKYMFPSPIGELHFSMKDLVTFKTMTAEKVSVPYRGATFLNTIPATPCPVWDE